VYVSEIFREKSPAEFFKDNPELAGFSNPTRALYTSIRELFENAMDAAELLGVPPKIIVRLLPAKRFGLEAEDVYLLRVEDNGIGIPPENVPPAFCKVFYGSKYVERQTRGHFGMGASMVVLYSQARLGTPVRVLTSPAKKTEEGIEPSKRIYEFVMKIDLKRNEPIVLKRKKYRNKHRRHGTIVELFIPGDYSRARSRIVEYFRQTAIIAPYASITFVDPSLHVYHFYRASDEVPPPPKDVKPHPYGIDLETLQRMIAELKPKTVLELLTNGFQQVGKKTALYVLEAAGIDPKADPRRLSVSKLRKLIEVMQNPPPGYEKKIRFRRPTTESLSPAGLSNIERGLRKEVNAEIISTHSEVGSYSGHPFIVEVAIAYGGKASEGEFSIYRFANKIPLLYDLKEDVVYNVVSNFNRSNYGIRKDMPITILTHICSTKVPYKSAGKESVAPVPEIEKALKKSLRHAAQKIRLYLSAVKKERELKRKLSEYMRYLPLIATFSARLSMHKYPPPIRTLIDEIEEEVEKEKMRRLKVAGVESAEKDRTDRVPLRVFLRYAPEIRGRTCRISRTAVRIDHNPSAYPGPCI